MHYHVAATSTTRQQQQKQQRQLQKELLFEFQIYLQGFCWLTKKVQFANIKTDLYIKLNFRIFEISTF
jgi:hypothetical protein